VPPGTGVIVVDEMLAGEQVRGFDHELRVALSYGVPEDFVSDEPHEGVPQFGDGLPVGEPPEVHPGREHIEGSDLEPSRLEMVCHSCGHGGSVYRTHARAADHVDGDPVFPKGLDGAGLIRAACAAAQKDQSVHRIPAPCDSVLVGSLYLAARHSRTDGE